MADDLPTKWAGYLVVGLVLLATAAFGGLNDAPPPQTDEIAISQPHINDEVSLAVDRIILANGVDEYQRFAEDDAKYIVLGLTVINMSNQPIEMDYLRDNVSVDVHLPPSSAEGGPRLRRIEPPRPGSVAGIPVDGSSMVRLQPGVPSRVALVWPADSESSAAIEAGASVTVTIYDLKLGNRTLVYRQRLWGEPVAAAHVDMVPDVVDTISVAALVGDVSQ